MAGYFGDQPEDYMILWNYRGTIVNGANGMMVNRAPVPVQKCTLCGAIVVDTAAHTGWHDQQAKDAATLVKVAKALSIS